MSGRKFGFAWAAGIVWSFVLTVPAQAGVHCSVEQYAALPCQWSGFLSDWRMLRNLMIPDQKQLGFTGSSGNQKRREYQRRAESLEKERRQRELTAEEWADLGAYYLRLGDWPRALEVLQQGYRRHPRHFPLVANLGTAWQRIGNLDQASVLLQEAVQLAPARWRSYEEYHLRLVRGRRQRGNAGALVLDDLFAVRYSQADGTYEPGKLPAGQRLPDDALAIVQQLVLWLPDDPALVWQLAELAAATGELNAAGQLFDWLVGSVGGASAELRAHRQAVRQKLAESGRTLGVQSGHANHNPVAFRSRRALLGPRFDPASLPPIDPHGLNELPWLLLLETRLDDQFRPHFPDRLKQLDGHQVWITGFLQPLGEELESRFFMLVEYPISCWYCEMPEPTGIVLVELPEGKTAVWRPALVKVTGRLRLNATDPEDFVFQVKNARILDPD